jgi:F-type H+-transporting ATPase subunit delta
MMKSTKEIKREAKHLFRLCFVNGSLDEDRVRSVLQGILGSKRRGFLPLAGQFQRLVILDRLRHTAKVESAVPLSTDLQANVQASLVRTYGPELNTSFVENSALIGGIRIRVGSDVYDGSIKAGLAALENSF